MYKKNTNLDLPKMHFKSGNVFEHLKLLTFHFQYGKCFLEPCCLQCIFRIYFKNNLAMVHQYDV